MKINKIHCGKREICELVSEEILVKTTQNALDLMVEADCEFLVMRDINFEKDVWDLSTMKLGEILQKFTNYRIKLAITGDFGKYPSKTLKDFIYESNKHGEYLFVKSLDEVIERWTD